jgi:general secretion pathway protein J
VSHRCRGFTLLELLIGLVLLGFMLALLFGGFRLATNTWNAIETRLERSADEQAGLALVRRLIGSIQPLRWVRTVGQPLTFAGQEGRLAAVAPLTESVGLRLIELTIEAQPFASNDAPRNNPQAWQRPGQQLVLREQALNYDAERFDDFLARSTGHRLIGDIGTASFSYFGAEKPGELPDWHNEWKNPEQLPKLIRLRIDSGEGGAIELVVATMISGHRTSARTSVLGQE